MEKLDFRLQAKTCPQPAHTTPPCGVVGSGNLEVLLRPNDDPGVCAVTVHTSALGFDEVWQAVLTDFAEHNPVGGIRITINDLGATPAVVSLRVSQALNEYLGDIHG